MTATQRYVACPLTQTARKDWRERGGVRTRCAECRRCVVCDPGSIKLRDESGFILVCRPCWAKIESRTAGPLAVVPVTEVGTMPTPDDVEKIVGAFERRAAAGSN